MSSLGCAIFMWSFRTTYVNFRTQNSSHDFENSRLIIFRVKVVKYVIRIEIFTTKSQCFHSRTFLDALRLNRAYLCVIFYRK